ncbi:(d)CMP kinase [Pelagibius sp. CAU 1746]|uniref:(d)CMP kinase n=1 Tax=Pelagibius sp. CAU 1746 TaxID=3140370 RepID=UPI00325B0AC9
MIIAVDGPVAAGKGTLARRLAAELNYAYLDTGSIYRAVAARILAAGGDPQDPETAAAMARDLTPADLERDDLRREDVGQAASQVAAIPAVRAALLDFQRGFAARPPAGPGGARRGAVLDGRDIGTVVCPEADVKLFLTASVEARAERRHKELLERGEKSIYARVLQDLRERDARDSGRATAPLKAAEDAVRLDTSGMDADQAFEFAMAEIARRRDQERFQEN